MLEALFPLFCIDDHFAVILAPEYRRDGKIKQKRHSPSRIPVVSPFFVIFLVHVERFFLPMAFRVLLAAGRISMPEFPHFSIFQLPGDSSANCTLLWRNAGRRKTSVVFGFAADKKTVWPIRKM